MRACGPSRFRASWQTGSCSRTKSQPHIGQNAGIPLVCLPKCYSAAYCRILHGLRAHAFFYGRTRSSSQNYAWTQRAMSSHGREYSAVRVEKGIAKLPLASKQHDGSCARLVTPRTRSRSGLARLCNATLFEGACILSHSPCSCGAAPLTPGKLPTSTWKSCRHTQHIAPLRMQVNPHTCFDHFLANSWCVPNLQFMLSEY
jgi:hypothetical protein